MGWPEHPGAVLVTPGPLGGKRCLVALGQSLRLGVRQGMRLPEVLLLQIPPWGVFFEELQETKPHGLALPSPLTQDLAGSKETRWSHGVSWVSLVSSQEGD